MGQESAGPGTASNFRISCLLPKDQRPHPAPDPTPALPKPGAAPREKGKSQGVGSSRPLFHEDQDPNSGDPGSQVRQQTEGVAGLYSLSFLVQQHLQTRQQGRED